MSASDLSDSMVQHRGVLRGRAPLNPYPGLEAFGAEQWEVFFGRENESVVISANLAASRLTVLYGPSGVGKSSLLQAGVLHSLDVEARTVAADPYARPGLAVVVNDWHSDPLLEIDAGIRERARWLRPESELDEAPASESLPQLLDRWSEFLRVDLLLILDQFEEFFLYESATTGFANALTAAMRSRNLSANFLISLREESLALLDRFKDSIPGLLSNRLRLAHLTPEAAEDAIRRPLDVLNRSLAPGTHPFTVEGALVAEVIKEARIEGHRGEVAGVEAPFVSLVMEDVWRREMESGSHALRAATLEAAGGPAQIARSHVDRTLRQLAESDRDVAASLFEKLLTPTGSKIALNARDLATWTELPEDQVSRVLSALSAGGVRVLRPKRSSPHGAISAGALATGPQEGASLLSYEVFHDLLAPGIINWSSKRRAEQELRLAQAVDAERRAKRRDRAFAWAGVAVLILALIGAALTLFADLRQNEIDIVTPFLALMVGVAAAAAYRDPPADRSGRWRSAGGALAGLAALVVTLANGTVFGEDAAVRGLFVPSEGEPAVVANDLDVSVTNSPGAVTAVEIPVPLERQNYDGEPTISVVDEPVFGTVDLAGGAFVFVAEPGFSGADSFSYEVCLPEADLCDTSEIRVAVLPYALDDEVQTVAGMPVTIGVLANDSSQNLEVWIDEPPGMGQSEVVEAGEVVYVPRGDFTGTDSFTYRACADDLCASAKVTIVAAVTEELVVPDVVGSADAGAALRVLGFQVVETKLPTACVPAGQAVAQSPNPGTSAPPGTQVSITTSDGGVFLTDAGCAGSAYDEAVLASGPIVYWPLAAQGGLDPVQDVIAEYDLAPRERGDSAFEVETVEGPQQVGAVSLRDTAGQRLESSFNPAVELESGPWTVEGWLLLSEVDVATAALHTIVGGWNDGARQRWYVNVRDGGKLCIGIGAESAVCVAGAQVDDGRWHHFAVGYEPGEAAVTAYLDGRQVTLESTPWSSSEPLIDAPVAVGAMYRAAAAQWEEHWDGALSRIAVYDDVLDPEQVLAHYEAIGPEPDLRVEIPLEAEDATDNTLATENAASASGGAYIVARAGRQGGAELSFDIRVPGSYVVWARVDTSGYDGSNSFQVAMDDGEFDTWDVAEEYGRAPLPGGWNWELISTRCGGDFDDHACDPRVFDLDAGRHTLRIRARELNTKLDAIVIANSVEACSIGVGCAS